ncbi:hypothetical protein [Limnohabitans sp. Rim8]|uniref:hypothetical protein n=1 Tax=Limnohabitans sp. Rim8 TaxID=1100718 RepID=UPI003305B50B
MFLNPALDTSNPFLVEVEEKLYEYFCKGVILANGKNLALGGGMLVLMSPLGILIPMLNSWHKLLLLLLVWWFSIDYLAPYAYASEALIYFGFLGLFWKALLDEIQNLFKGFLIFITWGGALKLLCQACLNKNFFGQAILVKGKNEKIVASLAGVLGGGFRGKYDRLVDLYLNSNTDWGREALREFLDKEKN